MTRQSHSKVGDGAELAIAAPERTGGESEMLRDRQRSRSLQELRKCLSLIQQALLGFASLFVDPQVGCQELVQVLRNP